MRTILIVDDEVHFVTLSQVLLQRAGYNTLAAYDAQMALQLIERHAPDLILLDDMMPGMSGSELCLKLKTDPQWQHIPVVMHTAGVRLQTPEQVEAIRADAVLFKPSMPQDILATVAQMLQQVRV